MNARVFIGVVEGTYGCLFKHACAGMWWKIARKAGKHKDPTAMTVFDVGFACVCWKWCVYACVWEAFLLIFWMQ